MPALPELQRRVMDALLRRGDPAAAAALVAAVPGLDAARRLQLYRNNLFESLHGALAAVYPVLRQLVGEECFRGLARRYVAAFPSLSGDIHDYGDALPGFVGGFGTAASLPYLADLTALEWSVHAVYHEAPLPALQLAALAALPPRGQAALRLRLQPSARLLASDFPVLAVWQAHQDGAAGVEAVDLRAGGVRLMVAQRDLEVEFRLLGLGEHRWLQALDEGQPLGDACALAMRADAGFDLAAALARQLALGSFVAPRQGAGP